LPLIGKATARVQPGAALNVKRGALNRKKFLRPAPAKKIKPYSKKILQTRNFLRKLVMLFFHEVLQIKLA
jgi:hypothetical protein